MSKNNESNRIHDFINIDKKLAQKLLSQYDSKLEVIDITLILEGLSTSNYIVTIKDANKKYLLKVYPDGGVNSEIEVASYMHAKQFVNVPTIYLFDNSKQIFNRSYVIMEYIDGVSLKEYINHHKSFPEHLAYEIGSKLARLHEREYSNMGLFNKNLEIEKTLLPVAKLHEHYLNGTAGTHIKQTIKEDLLEYIIENKHLIMKLEEKFVYSHGDFNPANILIDNRDSTVWFIDFEYSLAAPIYYDIGKFFRENAYLDQYRNKNTYDHFINGYNAIAKFKVPTDWIKLAKLMDLTGMLALLNKQNPPNEWIEDIEIAIENSMRILIT